MKDRGTFPEALGHYKPGQPIYRDWIKSSKSHRGPTPTSHYAEKQSGWLLQTGDLVHVACNPRVPSESHSNLTIAFWPAIAISEEQDSRDQTVESEVEKDLVIDEKFIILQLFGFERLDPKGESTQKRVPRWHVFPYTPHFDTPATVDDPLTDDISQSSESSLTYSSHYSEGVRRAQGVYHSWSLVEPFDVSTETDKDGMGYIRPTSIWWGSEKIQVEDFVRIRLTKAETHQLEIQSKSNLDGLNPDAAFFAKISEFEYGSYSEAGIRELRISATIFKLGEAVEENNPENLSDFGTDPDEWHLPAPPAGFSFVCVHDPEYEVCLKSDCLLGRYYPEGVARTLLENHISLVGSDYALERLGQYYEMQGLQVDETAGKMFSSECVIERGPNERSVRV